MKPSTLNREAVISKPLLRKLGTLGADTISYQEDETYFSPFAEPDEGTVATWHVYAAEQGFGIARPVGRRAHSRLVDVGTMAPSLQASVCQGTMFTDVVGHLFASSLLRQVGGRLADLEELGREEGIEVSAASRRDLIQFLNGVRSRIPPRLFLLESGNLRAVWRGDLNEQVGLEFLGGEAVRFVLLANRPLPVRNARSVGIENLARMHQQIIAASLGHLMQ